MRAYALGVGVNARIYDADNSWERGVLPFLAPVCVMYMHIHQCEKKEHSRDTGQTKESMCDKRASGAGASGTLYAGC